MVGTAAEQITLEFDKCFWDTPMTKKFREFHNDNPHVFDELLKMARQLKRLGHNKYSMKTLFEVVRWHRSLKTTDTEFKLNNNFTAYYSRLVMVADSNLDGFFRVRASEADKAKL